MAAKNATKSPATKAEPATTRPKTLSKADAEAARIAEEKRAARNAYTRAWRAKQREASAAAPTVTKAQKAPAKAPRANAEPAAPPQVDRSAESREELAQERAAALAGLRAQIRAAQWRAARAVPADPFLDGIVSGMEAAFVHMTIAADRRSA